MRGLVAEIGLNHDVAVVAPVPYCPPLLLRGTSYGRYREIAHERFDADVHVLHPRYPSGPGTLLERFEMPAYTRAVIGAAKRLVEQHGHFDLIHAHFVFPDGIAAMELAKQFQIPVVITDHAYWLPWMENPFVKRLASNAVDYCSRHLSVSDALRKTVVEVIGEHPKLRTAPIGYDDQIFSVDENATPDPNQILYVGRIHKTKGTDILLRAMSSIVKTAPQIKLKIVGGSMGFNNYQKHEREIRALVEELSLDKHVEFVGEHPQRQIARFFHESAMLVVPSRRETFGAVALEALACGRPVLATRCGGPEEIIDSATGLLVDKEDPEALATAIVEFLPRAGKFERLSLNAAARAYTWSEVAKHHLSIYDEVINEQ